ncbi:hypothetical protein [Pseudolactococcus insecticola]|uniref:Uncharacterized protein n=1 Tax=Pseudolactococcus insecticola TaxID=2709158 RepID=A0A6A0B9W6_9LACT|nr:hypothetical protein [Lactococcus insecticola]GFH41238.1 hypothetical protein Hs20B_16360 [Lactococcus insecticola]
MQTTHPEDPTVGYPGISKLRDQMMIMDTAPKWPKKPRFRLKEPFLKEIVQAHFDKNPHAIDVNISSFSQFDALLNNFTLKYQGKPLNAICEDLGLNIKDNKGVVEKVMAKYFGSNEAKLKNVELFSKVGIIPKSITLSPNGKRTEDMKFDSVDFDEWTENETFEESAIFDYFSNHNFVFLIYEEAYKNAPLKKNKFIGFKRIMFDEDFVDRKIRDLWTTVRNLVVNNELKEEYIRLKKTGEIRYTPTTNVPMTRVNFPKSTENIAFLRGTGSDAAQKTEMVNGIRMYRQYFWLRGDFMVDLLDKIDYL